MTKATKSPLRMSCKASNCTDKQVARADRRHAFESPTGKLEGIGGGCIRCGTTGLVDWDLCRARDPREVEALTAYMRLELIRDTYWRETLPERVMRNARRRGAEVLRSSAELKLRSALRVGHPLERRQTTFGDTPRATIIHCAQHATGTCCRECLEKWHGFPPRQELDASALAYLVGLVDRYVDVRLSEPILERAA